MGKQSVPLSEKLMWSAAEVAGVIGICRSSLYNRMAVDETFPRPQPVGNRRLWLAEDVRKWVADLYRIEAG